MIDHNTGLYKIGRSRNPGEREATLQSQKPSIEMIAVTELSIEKGLHKMFKEKRIRGEWFELNQHDVEEIIESFKDGIVDI